VPAQQRRRGDEERRPAWPRQQPGQTGGSQLPQLGWETLAVIAVVVATCLALVLLPWSGPAGVRRAIAMTTTVRNLSLALFVASAASATVVLTLLAYGLIMYGLSLPVAWWLARSTSAAATL
jgi:BASS family bile acid:Na+ symporter